MATDAFFAAVHEPGPGPRTKSLVSQWYRLVTEALSPCCRGVRRAYFWPACPVRCSAASVWIRGTSVALVSDPVGVLATHIHRGLRAQPATLEQSKRW